MFRPAQPEVKLLREGHIPIGQHRLRLGTTIHEVARTLGLDPAMPAHRWKERDGSDGCWWMLDCGFLWYPPPGHKSVKFVFHANALESVHGVDPSWESSGHSWETYDPAVDIRNYRKSRRDLELRLGRPTSINEAHEAHLVALWQLGVVEVSVVREARTPSVGICVGSRR